MSYRSWEPNAIGSIVPPFAGLSTPGPPPPSPENDRFAPKHLVGNVPAGDDASTTGLAPGFFYYPDPGDGSAIAAALAAASVSGGDVWIRPGDYVLTFSPLLVPSGVRVRGASRYATRIIGPMNGEQTVFVLDRNSSLEELTVDVPALAGAPSGGPGAIRIIGTGAFVRRVSVSVDIAPGAIVQTGIFVSPSSPPPPEAPAVVLEEVSVRVIGSGPSGSGIQVESDASVSGRNIRAEGSNLGTGIETARARFSCYGLEVFDARNVGIRHREYGSVRVHRGRVRVGGAATNGILLDGGSPHEFFDVEVLGSGSVGVEVLNPTDSVDAFRLESSNVEGFLIGVRLAGQQCIDSHVASSTISARLVGIDATFETFEGLHVGDNTVRMGDGSATSGIQVRSNNGKSAHVRVHRNAVQTVSGWGIVLYGAGNFWGCQGNTIVAEGVNISGGIYVDGDFRALTISDNRVRASTSLSSPTPTFGIYVRNIGFGLSIAHNTLQIFGPITSRGVWALTRVSTIVGNAVITSLGLPAGIELDTSSNTNVVTSNATGLPLPVLDLGSANELAHNI